MVKINYSQFERFAKKVEQNLSGKELDDFINKCAKELAARLLRKVIKRTPVGDYPKSTGKRGGTLRRGWTGEKDVDPLVYANSLPVEHVGDNFNIEIINPVEYASYVESGHRTKDHKGWVEGRFMLKISEEELKADAPDILEAKLAKKLGDIFK